jgi:diacylglycerol kinase family enzyme
MQVTQKIAIDTQTPLAVQGDGDYIGETPIEISVVPQAVNILVAANKGEEDETCYEQHN